VKLTEHFTTEELTIPDDNERIHDNAQQLCEILLEPIRDKWGALKITSGERCDSHNHDVGGAPTSFHLYHEGKAAADFIPLHASVTQVFTWICMESKLMFDKVILEYEGQIPAIIHIQYDCGEPPRRQAFVGMTHGEFHGRRYTQVNVA
jgi:zinc D-Ala-D-Ala carboxypeptidase